VVHPPRHGGVRYQPRRSQSSPRRWPATRVSTTASWPQDWSSRCAGGPDTDVGLAFAVFFLLCVLVAGIYGAATVSRRILLVQSLPAAIGLVLVLLAR
jgi:Predicted membrane protein